MPIDVSILSTNEYLPQEIIGEEIPDKYLLDENGDLLYTATVFNSEENVAHLINFLFQNSHPVTEVYRDNNSYVLDLSPHRVNLIDIDYLEKNYQTWLNETDRKNTMNEYGMLIDFIGHAKMGSTKNYLLMVITNRGHCSEHEL